MILKDHMTSDSDTNLANKQLPLMLSDVDFSESDYIKMCHIASTQSSLGLIIPSPASFLPLQFLDSECPSLGHLLSIS